MFYKNARIFTSDFRFHTGAFEVKDGRFGRILPDTVPEDAVDLGALVQSMQNITLPGWEENKVNMETHLL